MPSPSLDKEFFRGARLSTIIPEDTSRSISDVIEEQDDDPEGDALFHINKQRDLVFFDEQLTVYIALKLSIRSAEFLETYVSRIDLKLDVWSVNSHESTSDSAGGSQREVIFSEQIKKSDDPILIIREDEDEKSGQLTAFVLWETSVVLNRPKMRLANAAITFVPSGSYAPERAPPVEEGEEYLPSFIPLPVNILEPLKVLPGLEDDPPYLAASRLERVLPHPPSNDNAIRLPFLPSPPIRVVPAMIARLRCSRLSPPSAASSMTIASLEIEIIPFMEIIGSLEQVRVSLANGLSEPLGIQSIPISCRSRDFITFLYKLSASQQPSDLLNTGQVSISLVLEIYRKPGCTSTIQMEWTTTVDLSPSLNPSFGPPSQPIQRLQRPSSLALATTSGTTTPQRFSTNLSTTGLKISFTAPRKPIHAGKPFIWNVLVVNNTAKPVKLALIPLPRVQYATNLSSSHNRSHAPASSNASLQHAERRHTNSSAAASAGDITLARAVCDENILYAMQHSYPRPSETDLVSLTAELRVGPLGPGACHECEIKMIALRKGALRVDAVRVVDLVREAEEGSSAVGVIADVRDLPDVIVV